MSTEPIRLLFFFFFFFWMTSAADMQHEATAFTRRPQGGVNNYSGEGRNSNSTSRRGSFGLISPGDLASRPASTAYF